MWIAVAYLYFLRAGLHDDEYTLANWAGAMLLADINTSSDDEYATLRVSLIEVHTKI